MKKEATVLDMSFKLDEVMQAFADGVSVSKLTPILESLVQRGFNQARPYYDMLYSLEEMSADNRESEAD